MIKFLTWIQNKIMTIAGINCTGVVKQQGIYGEIHVHDNVTSQAILTGVNYQPIDAFSDNGLNANCTPDAANNRITLTELGVYRVDSSLSMKSDTNNVVFQIGAFLDSASFPDIEQDNVHLERKVSTSGDVGSGSCCGIIRVTEVPTQLTLRSRHNNIGTVNTTFSFVNLNASYLGEL